MPTHRVTTPYAGALLSVTDYCCYRGVERRPSAEEMAGAYQIVLPRLGVYVAEVAGRTVIADPNRVLFFRPGDCYRVRHPAAGGDRSTVLTLGPELAAEIAGHDGALEPPENHHHQREVFACSGSLAGPRVFRLHRRLLRQLRRGETTPLEIEELGVLLAVEVTVPSRPEVRSRAVGKAATLARQRALAEAASELLNSTLGEPLSLAQLAARLGCSPWHLCRVFRRVVGMPLHRYRLRARLRTAFEALEEGANDLTALALRLGFCDHSHLTNAFRREFGAAPSAVRGAGASAAPARA